ncbi:hypothetical protein FKP32DRAFT_1604624 [Trametes sanguinea]|nr:hypothetical protein FKP32DRAFT_1604624 [Trametes sanguinea]
MSAAMIFLSARSTADEDWLDNTARPLLRPYLVALFLEAILFGAFSVTYTAGLWSIMRVDYPGKPTTKDRVIALASTVMWALAFAHVILTFCITTSGFADHAGSADTVWNNLLHQSAWSDGLSMGSARFAIYVTQTLMGDAFMIFRVFVVWGGRVRVIVLPVLLVMVDAAAGYMSLWIYSSGLITPVVFFSFSFFTNFLCTGLILWRTLRSSYGSAPPKLVSRRFTLDFRKVIEALLQSAAVYSAASIALVATNFTSYHYGFLVCIGVFPSLIGLVFSFIVMRLANRSRENVAHLAQAARWLETSGTTPAVRGSSMTFAAPTVSLPVTVPKAWDLANVESNDSLADEDGPHHPQTTPV